MDPLTAFMVPDTVMATLILIGFGWLAFNRKWLSAAGALIAVLIGIITFNWSALTMVSGWGGLLPLFMFFFLAQGASYLGRRSRHAHETRGIANILGNGLAAMAALSVGWVAGFYAALSAALSDTLSSELGLLSHSRPVLITTLKTVPTGENGAVSRMGLAAGVLGAALMGGLYFFVTADFRIALFIMISGFLGNLMDSVIGATLEREKLVDNMMTNFLASLTAMVALALLTFLF